VSPSSTPLHLNILIVEGKLRRPVGEIPRDQQWVGIWWHSSEQLLLILQSTKGLTANEGVIDSDLWHSEEWGMALPILKADPAQEYFAVPRGRVVYDEEGKRGVIYHGNETLDPQLKIIARACGYRDWTAVLDNHYLMGAAADALFWDEEAFY